MKRPGGYALILALTVVTALSVAALELGREVKISVSLAANFQDHALARLKALDGLEVAAQVILADDPAYDGQDEPWAALAEKTALADSTAEGFNVEVADLAGRINLNQLVSAQGEVNGQLLNILERLVILLGRDPVIVQALLDWLDPDNLPRVGGAEADEYARQGKDYGPRNGPLLGVGELAMIKGFDAELLNGRRGPRPRPGLYEFVTVVGGPKLNVNTAPAPLLRALAEDMTDAVVRQIVETRRIKPFKNLVEMRDLGLMNQSLYAAVTPLLDIKSGWFEISSLGRAGKGAYAIRAAAERRSGQVQLALAEVRP